MDIAPLVFAAEQLLAAEWLAQMCREIEAEIVGGNQVPTLGPNKPTDDEGE